MISVWLRAYVSWQPTCPSNLAEYLLIWHTKKGGRPIAQDYTDLHTHIHTFIGTYVHIQKCKAPCFQPHAGLFRVARSFTRQDISFFKFISKYYGMRKFQEEFRPEIGKYKPQKVAYITPGGLMCWRMSKYFYPHAEKSQQFFMLL